MTTVSEPRPAATVLLVRDGATGVEVYLQRRPQRLGFAGGLWVFPGGRVDDADRDPAIDRHWRGPSPDEWAATLGVPTPQARGYVVAAVRETLEEAGMLVGDVRPPADDLAAARDALLSGSRALAEVLTDLGVPLDTSALRYWAWWVTPEAEPRRYDTRFFVARVPRDAVTVAHTEEVVEERWVDDDEDLAMLPPTAYTLRAAVHHDTTTAVMDADRDVERIMPVVEGDEIVLPWNDRYRIPRADG